MTLLVISCLRRRDEQWQLGVMNLLKVSPFFQQSSLRIFFGYFYRYPVFHISLCMFES